MLRRNMVAPVSVALGLLLLLLLAWLPSDLSEPQQQRPTVLLIMHYDESNPVIRPLTEDLRYRMRTHHEYRVVEGEQAVAPNIAIQPVHVSFEVDNSNVTIRAKIDGQSIVVNGPVEVAPNLPAKLFSLINNRLGVVFAD